MGLVVVGLVDVFKGFFGDVVIQFFALVVEVVDACGDFRGFGFIVGNQKLDRFVARFNPPGRVDLGTYAKNNIIYRQVFIDAGET